jgi:hypothetical protein
MSAVEMEIRLIDGSSEAQAAFDRPQNNQDSLDVPSAADSGKQGSESTSIPATPQSQESNSTASQTIGTPASNSPPMEAIATLDTVAERLNELIGHLRAGGTGSTTGSFDVSPEKFARDVATFQQQIADQTNGNRKNGGESRQPSQEREDKTGPSKDDYRELRTAVVELTRSLAPRWLSEPIEKLIGVLLGDGKKVAKSSAPSPIQSAPEASSNSDGSARSMISPVEPATTTTSIAKSTEQSDSSATVPVVQAIPAIQEDRSSEPRRDDPPTLRQAIEHRVRSTKTGRNLLELGSRAKASMKRSLQQSNIGQQILLTGRRMRSRSRLVGQRIASSSFGRGVASVARPMVSGAARVIGGASLAGSSTTAAAGGTAAGATTVGAGSASIAAVVGPLAVVAGAVVALAAFVRAVNSARDELQNYSPEIAYGKAVGQYQSEMNRVDRAQRIGPELGRVERISNRFNEASQKAMTELLDLGLKFLPIFEAIANTVTVGIDLTRNGTASVNLLTSYVQQGIAMMTVWNGEDDKAAAKEVEQAKQAVGQSALDLTRSLKELMGRGRTDEDFGFHRDPDLEAILKDDGEGKPPGRMP